MGDTTCLDLQKNYFSIEIYNKNIHFFNHFKELWDFTSSYLTTVSTGFQRERVKELNTLAPLFENRLDNITDNATFNKALTLLKNKLNSIVIDGSSCRISGVTHNNIRCQVAEGPNYKQIANNIIKKINIIIAKLDGDQKECESIEFPNIGGGKRKRSKKSNKKQNRKNSKKSRRSNKKVVNSNKKNNNNNNNSKLNKSKNNNNKSKKSKRNNRK